MAEIPPDGLVELHKAVTNRLHLEISADSCDPKMMDAAIRFLKDNGINVDFGKTAEDKQGKLRAFLSDLPKFDEEVA